MKKSCDIPYRAAGGVFGLCDLYIPDDYTYPDVWVMAVHGGGWSGMSKESFAGVAEWLCADLHLPVCNINYRLCTAARWPACGDDCLAAARFLLDSGSPVLCSRPCRKLFIIGGSAGGHLALVTGLRLPTDKIAGLVSISGIADLKSDRDFASDRYRDLFGHEPDDAELRNADPASYLKPDSPPILCTHDWNDNVVPVRSAQVFLDAVHKNGTTGESYYYVKNENGYSHRIWIPDSVPHKLYPDIEKAVSSFILHCLDTAPDVRNFEKNEAKPCS